MQNFGTYGILIMGLSFLLFFHYRFPMVSQDDKEPANMAGITERHNYWRRELGLPPLKWSNQLAKVAQKWADELKKKGCKMEHSTNKYGENIYWYKGSKRSTPQKAVDAWAKEKENFNFETLQCNGHWTKCGHYTQLIWEDTKKVGCGVAYCGDEEIWVCNYEPAGNIVGQKPFRKK
ncbi:MAG: CAP domain-containing protein [Raineya sp.]|nr:CAP domain-containing protein [Raineya sp.]MDW8297589.1 CAP domain-containing protein [Raineya sp.]